MALSGLEIYKLLPKTNCRGCGFPTCLAFALALAKKTVSLDKCPYISDEAKRVLAESALPPIRLVTLKKNETELKIGNETVFFRHEEKFHNPVGIGFILEDDLSEDEFKDRVVKISRLRFERVGQVLDLNLIALRQRQRNKNLYLERLDFILKNLKLIPVLMIEDLDLLRESLQLCKDFKPLVYAADIKNWQEIVEVIKEKNVVLVVKSKDLEELSNLTKNLNSRGINDLVSKIEDKHLNEKVWDFTQIRRQALKKTNRSLGYPVMEIVENKDSYQEVLEVITLIAKYANIVLLKGIEPWQILTLLTFRQNIYSDPQKPLQIEPKDYSVGQVTRESPVLVTTNFSLTYYTVLPEIEASKIPSYLVSIDTEGMSVLTAWAAEKFTPEKITESIKKFGMEEKVSHKKLIIPGYVAVMSGDLEEKSGWQVIVGPREAAGIPSFLKNLSF